MRFLTAGLAALTLLLTGLQPAAAQRYYLVYPQSVPLGNRTAQLDLSSCNSVPVYTCPPTHNVLQYFENVYGDMAIDGDSNTWYITGWGSLYKGSLRDTACRFMAKLDSVTVNALVADDDGNLYAAANKNGVFSLYKYDSTGFRMLGSFPPGIYSSGDLFFYKGRLFMTCTDAPLSKGSLVEVSLPDPARSCYYMGLGEAQAFGAFSIRTGDSSRAFIVATKTTGSTLAEIDMNNRRLSGTICSFPYQVTGAAAPYDLTADSNVCTSLPPTAITGKSAPVHHFSVLQPAADLIRLQTNIDAAQISSLRLYDMSGRLVKSFNPAAFPHNLDISTLPEGVFILHMTTRTGTAFRTKLIKAGRP